LAQALAASQSGALGHLSGANAADAYRQPVNPTSLPDRVSAFPRSGKEVGLAGCTH
jgi:hypothetical protein